MKRELVLAGKSLGGASLTGAVLYLVATVPTHVHIYWPYWIFLGGLAVGIALYYAVCRQRFRFVRARRPCSSTPLVLSLNLAMCGLTWYSAAMVSVLVPLPPRVAGEGGRARAAREPGGFFFLFGVAGDEGVAGDLLDFPDVVVKQDVGEFVADVAVGASRVVARVVQGDGPAVGQVEGGGGERAGLEPLQFFEAGAVDEMVRRDDCDVQVLGDLPDVEHVVRAQPQLGPGKFGEPVSFGFESSSHGCYLPAGPYPRVVSLCCMSWSRSPGNREASGLKVGVARSRIRTDSGGGRGWCTARGPGRRCGGRPRR